MSRPPAPPADPQGPVSLQGPIAKLLDTIAERAPRLRAAGVLTLTIGDIAITLAPDEPRADPAPASSAAPPAGAGMDDADEPGLGPRKLKLRERPL